MAIIAKHKVKQIFVMWHKRNAHRYCIAKDTGNIGRRFWKSIDDGAHIISVSDIIMWNFSIILCSTLKYSFVFQYEYFNDENSSLPSGPSEAKGKQKGGCQK